MKKILFLLAVTAFPLFSFSQQKSCCSAPEQFAALANDKAFVNKHEDPIPYTFFSEKGKMVTIPGIDGKDARAFSIEATEASRKYILVFHEWWGLNDYIKQVAEKIFDDMGGKVNVLAIDLYDGKVATTKDSAQAYMKNLDNARVLNIFMSAHKYIGDDAEVGTIGWCMGGGYSLQAALYFQQHASACVMYYGMPEDDPGKYTQLNAEVLMIWANQDKWIDRNVVENFKKNMQAAGKILNVEEYAADHAFANPSNPHYNKELADDAYIKSINLLKQ